MVRTLIAIIALIFLAGCSDQPVAGPKPEPKPPAPVSTKPELSDNAKAFLAAVEKDPTEFYFSVTYVDIATRKQDGIVLTTNKAYAEKNGAILIDTVGAVAITRWLGNVDMFDNTQMPPAGRPLAGWSVYLTVKEANAYWFLGKERISLLKKKEIMGIRFGLKGDSLKAWQKFVSNVKRNLKLYPEGREALHDKPADGE